MGTTGTDCKEFGEKPQLDFVDPRGKQLTCYLQGQAEGQIPLQPCNLASCQAWLTARFAGNARQTYIPLPWYLFLDCLSRLGGKEETRAVSGRLCA
eukprot:1156493-Pelagomonas_calceolata.AAC.4